MSKDNEKFEDTLEETKDNKEPDSTPKVFAEEEGEKELPPELEVAENKDPVYVMNVGRPFRRTIKNQKRVSWTDYRGKRFSVEVIMYRGGDDSVEAEKMRLNEYEKCFVYYDGEGKILSKKVKPVDFAFDIMDYPHVIGYPIGTNKFDERTYTIKCGLYNSGTGELEEKPIPTLVENAADADHLLKEFGFLEICTKHGITRGGREYSKSINKPKEKVEGSVDWRGIEEVSDDKLPTKNKRSEGINVNPLPKLEGDDEE